MLRTAQTALSLLLLLLAGSAFAYPASSGCTYAWSTNYGSGSAADAAAAMAAAEASFMAANPTHSAPKCWDTFPLSGQTTCSGATLTCPGSGSSGVHWAAQSGGAWYHLNTAASATSGAGYTCPNGGTLSGSTCVCGSGYTDSGTACVADVCPSTGTSTGTHNVTNGWALSPVPDADDVVVDTASSAVFGSHCIDTGTALCGMQVDTSASGMIEGCFRSQSPNDEGLYRLSCDMKMKSTGAAACTADTSAPSNPAEPSADCPSGTIGTVNGKPVCLGTMPAHGVNFGQAERGGNPRAGTSPVDHSNTAREPSAVSGGGPDARGGPGVTVGPGGSVGTGNNSSGGSTGTGSTGPIEVDVETCGLPGTPPCKIDETGTPTGTGAYSASDTAADTARDALKGVPNTIIEGLTTANTSWGFSIGLPTGCTNPPSLTIPRWHLDYTLDLCAHQTSIHKVMSFLWAFLTVVGVLGMVRRTIAAGS
jgi:hypothetical protein